MNREKIELEQYNKYTPEPNRKDGDEKPSTTSDELANPLSSHDSTARPLGNKELGLENEIDFIIATIKNDLGYEREFTSLEKQLVTKTYATIMNVASTADNGKQAQAEKILDIIERVKLRLEDLPKPDIKKPLSRVN